MLKRLCTQMAAVTRRMYRFGLIAPFQKVRLPQFGTKLGNIFQKSVHHGSHTEGSRCLQSSARTCKMWEVPSQIEGDLFFIPFELCSISGGTGTSGRVSH